MDGEEKRRSPDGVGKKGRRNGQWWIRAMVFDGMTQKSKRNAFPIGATGRSAKFALPPLFFFFAVALFWVCSKKKKCAIRIKHDLGPGQLLLSAANG